MSQCETCVAVPPNSASDHGQLVRLACFSSGMRRAQADRGQDPGDALVARQAARERQGLPDSHDEHQRDCPGQPSRPRMQHRRHEPLVAQGEAVRVGEEARDRQVEAEKIPRDQQRQASAEEKQVALPLGERCRPLPQGKWPRRRRAPEFQSIDPPRTARGGHGGSAEVAGERSREFQASAAVGEIPRGLVDSCLHVEQAEHRVEQVVVRCRLGRAPTQARGVDSRLRWRCPTTATSPSAPASAPSGR